MNELKSWIHGLEKKYKNRKKEEICLRDHILINSKTNDRNIAIYLTVWIFVEWLNV